MENQEKGLIVKAIGGFYYVETSAGIYECRAKGIFRKRETSPVVGDNVLIETADQMKGTVAQILERKNVLLRPPLANLDKIFLVTSSCSPNPNTLVIDKFLAVCEHKEIEPIIVITKSDLENPDWLNVLYTHAGFQVIVVDNLHGGQEKQIRQVKELLGNSIAAFIGNTGVGKSSFLNLLYPDLELKTAQISQKLGRGRHTTRHVELYKLEDVNGYVADTPGFSSMDIFQYDIIRKEDLQYCYREFAPYLNECKFTGCSHTVEKGCAVLQALQDGKIESSRHESYCQLYAEAKNLKEWELK